MAYQPLARKYRPETFSDLIGQEAVSQALVNAIRLGREPCGIILSGVRGIGKTSSARVFAKALNCDSGPTPEPCNQCYSCKAISGNFHEDVLEIDGASNNGVAEIRALQETLGYTPQRSRYKVYIIDEVHMLSNSAFNALLKTLEEPPDNVIFVFATTELHKVPKTVISRCQTFYLKRVSAHAIHQRLREILTKEAIEFEDEALAIVSQEANGSVRDSLTLLDQVIALGAGKVTRESLTPLLTSLSNSFFIRLLDALIGKRAEACLTLIAELDQEGVEFESVVSELAGYLRHTMILKTMGTQINDDTLAKLSEEDKLALLEIGKKAPHLTLQELFHSLMRCNKELDDSWLDRFVFENYCLEWCLKTQTAQVTQTVTNPQVEVTASSANFASSPARAPKESPKAATPPPAPVAKATVIDRSMPATWEEFISRTKQLSPFQGRKLEDLSPLEYSAQKILVAVDPKSFVGEEILKPDAQKRFYQLFVDMFDFKGQFEVCDKARIEGATIQAPVPESMIERKARQDAELRKQLEVEAQQAPVTQAILNEFGGRIERTDIQL